MTLIIPTATEVVYAVDGTPAGPLVVVDRCDHCADAIGGQVLHVRDETGQVHIVFGHDVASTPVVIAPRCPRCGAPFGCCQHTAPSSDPRSEGDQ